MGFLADCGPEARHVEDVDADHFGRVPVQKLPRLSSGLARRLPMDSLFPAFRVMTA